MVHIAAIRSAVDRDDTAAIESAFRLLVEFPHAGFIEGADSIDMLTETLDRVVDHLSSDLAIMPSRTFEAIVRAKPNALVEGASYADGASVVAAHRRHWHAIFLMHAPRIDSRLAEPSREVDAPCSLTLELSRTLARGLDAFISAQPEAALTRPEAARIILKHTLTNLGHIGPLGEPVRKNKGSNDECG